MINSDVRNDNVPQGESKSIAHWMRIGGAVSIISAGVVFLFQGFDSYQIDLRYWGFLSLMVVLGAGGVFCYRSVGDVKGARLFFGLAALVVPVQFAQLGAMTLNLFRGSGDLSIGFVGLLTIMSFIVALGVSFSSFSILCRKFRWPIVRSFLLGVVLLLVPLRELPQGLLVLIILSGIIYWINENYFKRYVEFKTFEGWAVKFAISLPLVIALVRAFFHADTLMSGGGLCLLTGLFFMQMARAVSEHNVIKESLLALAFLLGASGLPAVFVSILEKFSFVSDMNSLFVILSSITVWSIWISLQSQRLNVVYRTLALLCLAILVPVAISSNAYFVYTLMLLLGLSVFVVDLYAQRKLFLISGVSIMIINGGALLILLFGHVNTSSWLTLAILGISILLLSSVVERFGSGVVNRGREKLDVVRAWAY